MVPLHFRWQYFAAFAASLFFLGVILALYFGNPHLLASFGALIAAAGVTNFCRCDCCDHYSFWRSCSRLWGSCHAFNRENDGWQVLRAGEAGWIAPSHSLRFGLESDHAALARLNRGLRRLQVGRAKSPPPRS